MSNRLRALRRRRVFAPLFCSAVAARGATVAFSPLDLTPALWIDPSDTATMFQLIAGTTTVTDGSVCGFQGDKSGASFNLAAAADDTTRPNWVSAGGFPYLSYDGVNDATFRAATLGLYAAGAASVFIAVRASNPTNGTALVSEGGSVTSAFVGWLQAVGTAQAVYQQRNDAAGGNLAGINASPFDNTDRVYGIIDDGSAATGYLDGVAGAPVTFTRTGAYTIDRFALGARVRGTPSVWFLGRVYGIVCVKRVLTAPEIASVTTYLGAKQGRVI